MKKKNTNIQPYTIFDLDGTLIDSTGKLRQDTRDAFSRLGVDISHISHIQDWYSLAASYGISREEFDASFDQRKTWAESLDAGEITLFPETIRCLDELKDNGVRISLLSMSTQEYTHQKLNHFKLIPYFEQIRVVHPNVKTKLETAKEIINESKLPTSWSVYLVGDNQGDVVISRDIQTNPSRGIYVNRKGNFPEFVDMRTILPARNLREVNSYILDNGK